METVHTSTSLIYFLFLAPCKWRRTFLLLFPSKTHMKSRNKVWSSWGIAVRLESVSASTQTSVLGLLLGGHPSGGLLLILAEQQDGEHLTA